MFIIEEQRVRDRYEERNVRQLFSCNYAEPITKIGAVDAQLTNGDMEQIKVFLQHPLAYERLIDSIAPNIVGEPIAKECALLTLSGSYPISLKDGTKLRDTIHMFLCGDPGMAKSDLLLFCTHVAPRAVFTNGRNSSAAGLTASTVRDSTGNMGLEPGATVLADQGICAIDEFGNMREEDRVALHDVMEQQIISINKAGISATLNARTSIIAAANPINGKYDMYKSILENLEPIPIPILTRFDFIVIMRDPMDRARDNEIAKHILTMYTKRDYVDPPPMDFALLKKYIAFIRTLKPEVNEDVYELILKKYQEVKGLATPEQVPITPRWLESLIRASIARARLLMHPQVTQDDVRRAMRLIDRTMKTAFFDPQTKMMDTAMASGFSTSKIDKRKRALETFRTMSGEEKNPVNENAFVKELVASGKYNESEAWETFNDMWKSGVIYEKKKGEYLKA